jgi:hypothetical protein
MFYRVEIQLSPFSVVAKDGLVHRPEAEHGDEPHPRFTRILPCEAHERCLHAHSENRPLREHLLEDRRGEHEEAEVSDEELVLATAVLINLEEIPLLFVSEDTMSSNELEVVH